MGKILVGAITFLLFLIAQAAHGQVVQVSRTNKTIEVSLTESVRVDSETAAVKVGYHNYGRSKETAYEENVRMPNQITRAMLEAGIPKETVETSAVRLERTSNYESPAELRKDREFAAQQSWTVRVPVSEAQKVMDLAVSAGANLVEDVEWTVTDPVAIEVKANVAALAKARTIAEQMARQLGARLGELLYASNREPSFDRLGYGVAAGGGFGTSAALMAPPKLQLKLFPAKFESSATVTAVFALDSGEGLR